MGVLYNDINEFPVEHPPLLSCTEVEVTCQGFGEIECTDEPADGDELCKSCRRAEERHYQLQAMEAEGIEPLIPYPHLTD